MTHVKTVARSSLAPSFASLLVVAVIAAGALALVANSCSAEEVRAIPAPATDAAASATTEKAVLAGGCFWGVQGVYQHAAGVLNAVSGYAGGEKSSAVYEKVGTGRTGHAEIRRGNVRPRQDQLRQDFTDLLLGRA